MSKPHIQIIIAVKNKSETCEAHCGADWSSAETTALAKKRIKERFGEGIQLEYFDLSEPGSNPHVVELGQLIRSKNLSLPLLVINGKPRISGEFDIRQLLDAVEAEIETRLE